MPTLEEFIERVRLKFGIQHKRTPALAEGPDGPVRYYYLQRADRTPFVVIPNMRYDARLERKTVVNWCDVFGIPLDEFGLTDADR
jgi:hypothetical protein